MDDFSQYPILFVVAIIIGWLAWETVLKPRRQQEEESAAILKEWGGWLAPIVGFCTIMIFWRVLVLAIPYPPIFLALVCYWGFGFWLTKHWRFQSKGAWLLRMVLALLWPLHRGRRK